MKRLILLLLFVVSPSLVVAQETYSTAATAPQVAVVEHERGKLNEDTCRRFSIPAASCVYPAYTGTQALACVAANAAGGASCTAAQARTAFARIFPNTQAGREELVTFRWILDNFTAAQASMPMTSDQRYRLWWCAQTVTLQNSECAKIGAPNGCRVCP